MLNALSRKSNIILIDRVQRGRKRSRITLVRIMKDVLNKEMTVYGHESCSSIGTSWYFQPKCPLFKNPPPPIIELSKRR